MPTQSSPPASQALLFTSAQQSGIQVQFRTGRDLVYFDKPNGISTHAVEKNKPGFVELMESRLGKRLLVCHRLDKTTSGALVFALTPHRAEELRQEFTNQRVRKSYLFLTDRRSQKESLQIHSDDGSETHFERIKRSPYFELWKALPKSGKTHQIRKHAAELGLAILGDPTYGGTPFPTLCLHSAEIEIPGEEAFVSPPPRYFERLGLLRDSSLIKMLCEVDRRQRLFNILGDKNQCVRLIDLRDLRYERFGGQGVFQFYGDTFAKKDELRLQFLAHLLSLPSYVQLRKNRGADPLSNPLQEICYLNVDGSCLELNKTWQGFEDQTGFLFASDRGLSFGLFLDQRLNRRWVKDHARGKRVLNLFSYTGGFSVAAAAGGASQVVSVDISTKYLNWSRENFQLNGLSEEPHLFTKADSLDFLSRAEKKSETYDLIVCDPPTFSRTEAGTFRIEKDMVDLVERCLRLLRPQGRLLFSCNVESLSASDIERKLANSLPKLKIESQPVDFDCHWPEFECPTKSFVMSK